MGLIYHCGCVDDHYLSPYQTRATWLPWLLRKSRPFVFKYRPLGPIYFSIWCLFTIVGVWIINTYHHTKPEPSGCLGCSEKAGPLYLYGPLGPLTFICGAKMVIHFHSCIMPHTCVKFGPWAYFSFWSTRGAKKFALGPLGPLTFVLGAKMVVGFHPCNIPHKCAKFGPWGYFTF